MEAETVVPMQPVVPLSSESSLPPLVAGSQSRLQGILDGMQGCLDHEQCNAFQLGKYVNTIQVEGLATAEGYRNARACLLKRLRNIDEGTISNLYRYARVATYFTEAQAKQFGMTKLDHLRCHQEEMHGRVLPGDPGGYEVELLQEDGSISKKAFRDCSVRDLRRNFTRRMKAKQLQNIKEVAAAPTRPELKRVAEIATPGSTAVELPKERDFSFSSERRPLQLLALGIVVTFAGELVMGLVGSWIVGVGSAMSVGATALLLRDWFAGYPEWKRVLGGGVAPVVRALQRVTLSLRKVRLPGQGQVNDVSAEKRDATTGPRKAA